MRTILVVDDEFAVLEGLSMAIEHEGHRVLKAGDGADALRILQSQPCDVVVCDGGMPIMNGLQLIAAMRADPRLAAVPVILMFDTYGRPLPSADAHTRVLAKPVMLADLLAALAQA